MQLSSAVFPEPEGPMRATNLPGSMSRFTWRNTSAEGARRWPREPTPCASEALLFWISRVVEQDGELDAAVALLRESHCCGVAWIEARRRIVWREEYERVEELD